MSLVLYSHPFASFCQKVLIALYENGTPFEQRVIDLANESERLTLAALWPVAKFPVLRDEARNITLPESSIVIEYLSQHYPGPVELLPTEPERALETRLWDRFFDLYVGDPMQRIVGDRLRPAEQRDALGVQRARESLRLAYEMIDTRLAGRTWALGDAFTLADCSASASLMYANVVEPIAEGFPHARDYLTRLCERPAYARVLREAEPYWVNFPRAS